MFRVCFASICADMWFKWRFLFALCCAEDSYPNEMMQAELSLQLGLTIGNCRCGSAIAGSRTAKICWPRFLSRLKDYRCVTGKHTCMLSFFLSCRYFMPRLISFAEVQDIVPFLLNTLAEHNILFYLLMS